MNTVTDNGFICDGWRLSNLGVNRLTGSLATDGYTNGPSRGSPAYLNFLVGAAGAPGASDAYGCWSTIEGQFFQPVARFGTPAASYLVVTFDVLCSVPGTYAFALRGGTPLRSFIAPVVVNAANVWETKTIVIPGDSGGAGWVANNTAGAYLSFCIGAGSVSTAPAGTASLWQTGNFIGLSGQTQLVATAGAVFKVGNFQIERGQIATPFELIPYDTSLRKAQRYSPVFSSAGQLEDFAVGTTNATNGGVIPVPFPVPVRTPVTGLNVSAPGHFGLTTATVSAALNVLTWASAGIISARINATAAGAPYTQSQPCYVFMNDPNALLAFTGAEL